MVAGNPVSQSHFFFYFAYGSNLLEERLHVQIKDAVFECTGRLSNYKLCFYDDSSRWHGALASVEEVPGEEVWGCVWRVPNSFADELDLQENVYKRLQVNIDVADSVISCRTYQYLLDSRKPALPSPHYKHVIVSGAIEHSLPPSYVAKLKEVKDNGYTGSVLVNLQALKNLPCK
ncbi:unnamed protein product [Enterobius vermicularis]|uniref:gamma-glutamylcyclotransferase n=1 Tax=Enterobius vermicularis TaxID=51028 RepID=A0A0N4UUY5_ENTVE|nr:unnamed protein product [Enterobius vermicularis]